MGFEGGDYDDMPPTPMLLAHGAADVTVPIAASDAVYEMASPPVGYLRTTPADHATGLRAVALSEGIVLAAEEPSRIRGGARLGGIGGPLDNFVGEATKYVVRKAPCRVVLTAPAADAAPPAPDPPPPGDRSV